jgi:molybdate transport system permease protein
VLLVVGSLLAYALVYRRIPVHGVVDALINLPMMLPPTVLGFYLLLLMSPRGVMGRAWNGLTGSSLLFTFTGIVIASIFYSLPFAVQPLKASFSRIDRRILENASVLGLSPLAIFFKVIVPNSLAGFVAAAILVFLHTMGEFGVILMVGGSIPGKTRVASIAIYEAVESLKYQDAWIMSLILALFSFTFLIIVNQIGGKDANGLTG